MKTPNGGDARWSELFVRFPRARMAGGGLKGGLAAMAREKLEEEERESFLSGNGGFDAPGSRRAKMVFAF